MKKLQWLPISVSIMRSKDFEGFDHYGEVCATVTNVYRTGLYIASVNGKEYLDKKEAMQACEIYLVEEE